MSDQMQKVFLSSTYKDLIKVRKEVFLAILDAGYIPVGMELFPVSHRKIWHHIESLINKCEYYILIIGYRYGSTTKFKGKPISWTEREYDHAIKRRKPILAFLPGDLSKLKKKRNQNNTRVLRFITKVEKQGRLKGEWKNINTLTKDVGRSLYNLKERNYARKQLKRKKVINSKIVSLIHEKTKRGKDYQKIIHIHNDKFIKNQNFVNKSNIDLIKDAEWLCRKLVSSNDDLRTEKKIMSTGIKQYQKSFSTNILSVLSNGKIVVKKDWGEDYALLYSLCYFYKQGLDNPLATAFYPFPGKNWWSKDWEDVALYVSQICNDDALIKGIIKLASDYNGNLEALSLICRIIQLKPSISTNSKISGLLDAIIYKT